MSSPGHSLTQASPAASPSPADQTPLPALGLSKWFAEEVHPHGAQLKSWLKGNFPAVRDVEDVVQESYLRIWKARASQPIASAKSYLFSVARHLALNLLRRERNAPVFFDGGEAASCVLEDKPGVAETLSEREKVDLLADALATLPARTRAILLLHKFDGLPQAEVARRFGCSEKAVEHQVARGLRLCTEFFRSRGHEHF